MRISNIFIGQRRFDEPLDFSYSSRTEADILSNVVNGKINFSPTVTEGGTHQTTILNGDIFPNKTGWFDVNLEFMIDRNVETASVASNIELHIKNQHDNFIHIQSDRIEFGSTGDHTLRTNFRTPFMKYGDYFWMEFLGLPAAMDIKWFQIQIKEVTNVR